MYAVDSSSCSCSCSCSSAAADASPCVRKLRACLLPLRVSVPAAVPPCQFGLDHSSESSESAFRLRLMGMVPSQLLSLSFSPLVSCCSAGSRLSIYNSPLGLPLSSASKQPPARACLPACLPRPSSISATAAFALSVSVARCTLSALDCLSLPKPVVLLVCCHHSHPSHHHPFSTLSPPPPLPPPPSSSPHCSCSFSIVYSLSRLPDSPRPCLFAAVIPPNHQRLDSFLAVS